MSCVRRYSAAALPRRKSRDDVSARAEI